MRKLSIILSTVSTLLLIIVGNVFAQQQRVDVCHIDEEGNSFLITVAEAAYDNHIAHGDAAIGDPVPGMTGVVFDENCQPEPGDFPMGGCQLFMQSSGDDPLTYYINFGTGYSVITDYFHDDSDCLTDPLGEPALIPNHAVYAPAPYDALVLCQSINDTYTTAFSYKPLEDSDSVAYVNGDIYGCFFD